MDKTIILYHGGCPDGFGGAYAAWKKFGDTAEYIPLDRSEEPPVEACTDAIVYFVDFCYNQDTMDQFVAVAKELTVLDHHEGVEEVIKSMPEYVFASDRSGAGIAWDYFHPGVPRPILLNHVEDDDLFRFALPETREIMTYVEVQPREFLVWDEIAQKLDDPSEHARILEKAAGYREYFEILVEKAIEHAKLVQFEGYEVYFAAGTIKTMKSLIGNRLARIKGPFALVASPHPEGFGISIRGDGSVNVADIAQKYGGNGHPDAAGFLIPITSALPWTLIKNDEDTRD